MQRLLLTPDEMNEIAQRLTGFIAREKPFLKKRYTLVQLSHDISVPLNKLSAFINRHYQMNFNDMINKYRIEYCIQTFEREDWLGEKIGSIAKKSGFNNRNTFSFAFKKYVGVYPSEYILNRYRH